MTANQAAAATVLTRVGVPEGDMADALAAVEDVVGIFHPEPGPALTVLWECAAEFVGTFGAVTDLHGHGLRQVAPLARAAFKLQRF